MKIIPKAQLALAAVACLVLAGSIVYSHTVQANKAAESSHPVPGTSITINGKTTTAPPNQPLSETYISQDGGTRIDVSVNSHSSGNAQSDTGVTIRTDGSSNTETTMSNEEYNQSP